MGRSSNSPPPKSAFTTTIRSYLHCGNGCHVTPGACRLAVPLREETILNICKLQRARAVFVVVGQVIGPSAHRMHLMSRALYGFNMADAALTSFIPGSSHRSYPSGSWMTGMRLRTAEVTASGVVVRIEQVSTGWPLGPFQRSHIPADANNSH